MLKYCTKFVGKRGLYKNPHNCKRRHFNVHNKFVLPNLSFPLILHKQPKRQLYTTTSTKAKRFVERENVFAYGVLQLDRFPIIDNFKTAAEIKTTSDFNTFLNRDWKSARSSEIVAAFNALDGYCTTNNLNLSDDRFDKLVDGLLDTVEKLSTDDLANILTSLGKYPPVESFKSHNFHDVWSALDDVCCWKLKEWDLETMLKFADLWYKLDLGKVCDYIYEVLEKVARKPEKLTKAQLVQMFFYINVCRRRTVDFNYEHAVELKVRQMSVDELAIVAMGFFKSKTKIKIASIMEEMARRVKENIDTVHEISLSAILKVIRFSTHKQMTNPIADLLIHLEPQIDRLSMVCCLHIALLGTGLQIYNEKVLGSVGRKFAESIHDVKKVRLKDIERLLLAFSMFDYNCRTTPDIYELMAKELHREERLPEKIRHPRCMPSALLFLSIRNIYPLDLISGCLDPEFILEVYGKISKMIPREIFSLNISVQVECPEYTGHKLNVEMCHKVAKWLTDFTPTLDQPKKLSAADRIMLDVLGSVYQIVGNRRLAFVHHVLPHFSKADIILCVDKKTNKFVEPKGFENYVLGDVMRPSNTDDFKWFAVVPVNWNMTIRDTTNPVGMINMKARQLTKLGYEPVIIMWNEYLTLRVEDRVRFILRKMKRM